MEAMGNAYCEQSHRNTIKKLEVDEEISNRQFREWFMDWLFGDENHSDICTKVGDIILENKSDLAEKDTITTRS